MNQISPTIPKINADIPESVRDIYKCVLFEPIPGDIYWRTGFNGEKYHRDIADSFADEIGMDPDERKECLERRFNKTTGIHHPKSIVRGGVSMYLDTIDPSCLQMVLHDASGNYGPIFMTDAEHLLQEYKKLGFTVRILETRDQLGAEWEEPVRIL